MRVSVGVEFILEAEDEEDARSVVSEFVYSFPEQAGDDHDGDVIVQDAMVIEA